MHKCPKCGDNQQICATATVRFNPETLKFEIVEDCELLYVTCNACDHQFTPDDDDEFWGLI